MREAIDAFAVPVPFSANPTEGPILDVIEQRREFNTKKNRNQNYLCTSSFVLSKRGYEFKLHAPQ